MAGYIGSKAVNLSTTGADINGDANIDGTLTSDGLTVDGAATITVTDNSDTLTLVSTDADATVGPVLNLFRNSASPADNDVLGRIVFKGEDSAGNDATFARIEAIATDVTNGSEDGRIDFFAAKDDSFSAALSIAGQNVGIGTSSPSKKAHLYASNDSASLRLENTANSKVWDITPARPGVANTGLSIHNITDDRIDLHVDNSGNVGIGTSSPNIPLEVKGRSADGRFLRGTDNNGTDFVDIGHSGSLGFIDVTHSGGAYHDFAINTGGSERMRIDSSGNLYCSGGSGGTVLTLTASSGTTSGDIGRIRFGNNDIDSNLVNIVGYQDGATDSGGLKFETQPTGGATLERMRIDSSGNLLLNDTTPSAKLWVNRSDNGNTFGARATASSYTSTVGFFGADRNTTNGTFHYIDCYNYGSSTYRFRVADSGNVTNTNNSYGAISDVKLKENIVNATPKLDKLNEVRVVNYNFIGSEEKQLGVIAQELEQIMPNMVDENVDTDADGNDLGTTTKTVKYSVFVPMLIKAMQEQTEIINDLRARVAQLETN